MNKGLKELIIFENRTTWICVTVSAFFVLLPCLKAVHYALTIPSAIILMRFAAELSQRKYLRKRVREFDKSRCDI